ncbi:SMP-30/gluconolactonase/LRE family protein [Ectopseudomonas mendocina]|uniref:SMP-30/gluconolactonase/LRE family protein n=1 Tax=Ectopseudomonas mendocina TaxID=300 RepID=A0ABZ2RNX9_ECTME
MRKVFVVLLAVVAYLLFWPTSVRPVAWKPAAVPPAEGAWVPNQRMNAAIKDQSNIAGPDTVVQDADGWRYSGLEDGRIVRWRRQQAHETFVKVDGRPVGLAFGPDGSLFAADEVKGVVWKVTRDRQVSQVVKSTPERRFTFIDDLVVARDGRIFFTEASTRWSLPDNKLAMLEHGGDGEVWLRHPNGRLERVLDGLEFANGVVLSPDESYLLVVETGAYRITRLWLEGPRKGEREVILDNLPGFPGDISNAPDGTYWVSLFTPRKKLLDELAPHPFLRKVLARLPAALMPKPVAYPFVFRIDGDGKVLETLQAGSGSNLPSFSSVVQAGNELLLGTPGGVGEIDSDGAYRVRLN